MNHFNKTYIIAEAGVNHNGSLQMAKELIDAAVEAEADAVKFQTFQSESLVSRFAQKAEYQKRLTNHNESQLEMLKKLELDTGSHRILIDYCQRREIEFLSTPFDIDSANLLVKLFNLQTLKISSGDITNAPLLLVIARTGSKVILSTGNSNLGEVEQALSVLAFGYLYPDLPLRFSDLDEAYGSSQGQAILKEKVILLHCTSEYPTPFDEVNLKSMDTLSQAFGLPVGLSDHSMGISVPIAAVARGASVIEKHFTLDRTLPGPDHQASLEPVQLKAMVQSIREVEQALGVSLKYPSPSETKNRNMTRKSLVAKEVIRKGEKFSEDNLTIKRPGDGVSPLYYWDWIGKTADRDYQKDEVIK